MRAESSPEPPDFALVKTKGIAHYLNDLIEGNLAKEFQWGPASPHSLSKMCTALVRDGYYDEYGKHASCVKFVGVFGCDTSIAVEEEE